MFLIKLVHVQYKKKKKKTKQAVTTGLKTTTNREMQRHSSELTKKHFPKLKVLKEE